MRRLVTLPLLLAALAAGCGGTPSSAGDFEGEERRVAEAVEQLQSSGEARKAAEVCDEVFARALREAVAAPGSTCETEMEKALGDADDFALEVEDVTVDGTRATARVRALGAEGRQVRTLELVREGADWRVASLG